MTTKTPFFRSPICALALLVSIGITGNAVAQAYRGQIDFLETFAVRLYERGDLNGAMKEFDRIRRMDPNNAKAAEYLARIAKATGTTPADTRSNTERIDAIMGDMLALRQRINMESKGSDELVYLIRNLITENDALYVTLDMNAKKLAELRAKFNGTPYGDELDRIRKTMPLPRVPQELHQSNDLLALIGKGRGAAGGSEMDELIAEIVARKNTPSSRGASATPLETPQAAALERSLADERAMLIDKALTTLDRKDTLAGMHQDLTGMKTSLARTGNAYMEMIALIDKYYQAIKGEIAARNFTEQKQFADLLIDYTARLKEIDTLKTALAAKDATLPAAAARLGDQDKKLNDITAMIKEKDARIIEFKALLVSYKKSLAARDADLAYADRELDAAGTRVSSIETLLKENDTDLNDLKSGVARLRTLVAAGSASAPVAPAATAGEKELIAQLREEIAVLEKRLKEQLSASSSVPSPDKDPAILKLQINKNDRQLALVKEDFAATVEKLHAADKNLDEANAAIRALNAQREQLTAEQKERAAFIAAMNARISAIAANADNKNVLLDENKKILLTLTTQAERSATELGAIRTDLAAKDAALRKAESGLRTFGAELTKTEARAAALKNERDLLQEALNKATAELKDARTELTDTKAALPAPAAPPAITAPPAAVVPANIPVAAAVLRLTDENRRLKADLAEYERKAGQARLLAAQKETLSREVDKITTRVQAAKPASAPIPAPMPEPVAVPVAIPAPAPGPAATETAIRDITLDLQERTLAADKLQSAITVKEAALSQAEKEIALLQEKLSVFEIKQDGIKEVIARRDMQLERAEAEVLAGKKDLALVSEERNILKARIGDKLSAATLAEERLNASEEESAGLKKEVEAFRATATTAHAEIAAQKMAAEKTVKELEHLKETLRVKEAEIATLHKNQNDLKTK